jgi:predicted transcriptional regulator
MNGRRSDIEIIAEVLRLAEGGAGQTRIMYGSNLNYGRLRDYLAFLVARGLISVARDHQRVQYTTTDKGKRILDQVEIAVSALDNLHPISQV